MHSMVAMWSIRHEACAHVSSQQVKAQTNLIGRHVTAAAHGHVQRRSRD